MDVIGLEHVQIAIPVGGEEAARAFWVGRLGFEEVAKPAALVANGGCWFRRGTIQLHVGIERDFRPATKAHVALLVRDLDAARDALDPASVRPGEPLPGFERFFTDDPFGNRVEILARSGS